MQIFEGSIIRAGTLSLISQNRQSGVHVFDKIFSQRGTWLSKTPFYTELVFEFFYISAARGLTAFPEFFWPT